MAVPLIERHLLTIREGRNETTYVLDASAYSIGRDPTCAIVLTSKSVSRKHAILLRTPEPSSNRYRYRIIDGDSQGRPSVNGIQVNNQPCKEKKLEHKDYIVFGNQEEVQAQYRIEQAAALVPGETVRVAQYRSLKAHDPDSCPTIVGDEVGFETGTIVEIKYPQNNLGDGVIMVDVMDLGVVEITVASMESLPQLQQGDRVNLGYCDGAYMILSKKTADVSPGSEPKPPEDDRSLHTTKPLNYGDNTSLAAGLTHVKAYVKPQRASVVPPVQIPVANPPTQGALAPTLQGKGSQNLPSDLKNQIQQQAQVYRRCYETVVRELGDLDLSEAAHVTIAGQIFASLNDDLPNPNPDSSHN